MKRSELKRGTKPIRPVSKTKARRREQAAGPSMADLRPVLFRRCWGHCERCGRTIQFETFEAHHRKFRSRGGLDRIENLAALCGECHLWVHANSSRAHFMGFAVLRDEDPAYVRMYTWQHPVGGGFYLTPEGTYAKSHFEESHE